ncbi:hypothetical protein ILUMI_26096 [Ignelater luminosus]|uniref:DUF4371 domain-containing protein n=1 Tax=Ignelater luminosus TaxID=2038154 RepID=A0A8K0C6A9_IGNLU|nr:hypothetical protein ILUMI_26096 [Ignelater luminosus]
MSALTTTGFNNWLNVHNRLAEQEKSKGHLTAMLNYSELQKRLSVKETIDKVQQRLFNQKEMQLRQVFERFVSVVQFLAERNLAFRRSVKKLGNPHNGNIFGESPIKKLMNITLIITQIISAKYFAVILDCTPDSHQEQMSLTLSKELQSETIDISVAVSTFEKLLCWLTKYRDSGFEQVLIGAKEFAEELEKTSDFKVNDCKDKKAV